MANRSCHLCRDTSNNPGFETPGIVFNFLKGRPFLCERCIFKNICGEDALWDDAFVNLIESECLLNSVETH